MTAHDPGLTSVPAVQIERTDEIAQLRPVVQVVVHSPDGSLIEMSNVGHDRSVFTRPKFEDVQTGLRDVFDTFRIGAGIPSRVERIND